MSAILLHPADNVLVVTAPLAPGDRIVIDGTPAAVRQAIGIGHKIARHRLSPGDKVFKYGAPIGSVTQAAQCGEHVHLHNMKSDYIASHTREALNGSDTP